MLADIRSSCPTTVGLRLMSSHNSARWRGPGGLVSWQTRKCPVHPAQERWPRGGTLQNCCRSRARACRKLLLTWKTERRQGIEKALPEAEVVRDSGHGIAEHDTCHAAPQHGVNRVSGFGLCAGNLQLISEMWLGCSEVRPSATSIHGAVFVWPLSQCQARPVTICVRC